MEPILRTLPNTDWITLVLLVSLGFLVIAKSLHRVRFVTYSLLPFNNKYLFMYGKKDVLFNWFHVFVVPFQLLNTALFCYLGWQAMTDRWQLENVHPYWVFLAFIAVVFLLKIAVQLINGLIFDNNRTVLSLIFKKLSYFNYSGLLFLVANVLLAYVVPNNIIVVLGCIVLVFIVNAIGWGSIVKNHRSTINKYFFYFILYLCALEIAPIVLLGCYLKT